MTFLVYSTQIAKSYCWVKYTPKFEKWWSNMHRCMWLAYPEGFNSIEYSVILHWTIMSHSDFSENLSPIGFLGDLDWWFCICTAYRHLLIFRIDNVIIVRIRIWISDWYWLWANLNTHLLKKSLCDFVIVWHGYYEVYRRLARHSPRTEANIVKACNTMQWSQKIS